MCNGFHTEELFFLLFFFFYELSVGLMFASGGKWPSRELPVRTLQCAGLSTGRWMLHNSRRRHLGGMWGMRGGEADQRMREERGWSRSASVTVVVPRRESQADKMGQRIPTWEIMIQLRNVVKCADWNLWVYYHVQIHYRCLTYTHTHSSRTFVRGLGECRITLSSRD